MLRNLPGEGSMNQKRARPTTTSCVVGDFGRLRFGRRRRDALAIRSRLAGTVRLPGGRRGILLAPGPAHLEHLGVCSESVRRVSRANGENGLDEEGVQRKLEVGDRTVGIREGGPQMSEDVRGQRVPRLSRQLGGQLGRRALCGKCRADLALAKAEAFPDALQGAVTEVAVGSAASGEEAAGGGELEEAPQAGGGQAQASDFIGAVDAESPAAPRASVAIAAKDASGADGFLFAVLLVESVQGAVAIEGADDFAMRTGHLLEPLGKGQPILGAAAKPSLLPHGPAASTKIVILRMGESGGVEAGYERILGAGWRGAG